MFSPRVLIISSLCISSKVILQLTRRRTRWRCRLHTISLHISLVRADHPQYLSTNPQGPHFLQQSSIIGNNLIWFVTAHIDVSRVICLACTFPKVVPTPAPSLRHVEAGSRTFPLDCFSPVSPKNHLHQSLPFCYLTLTVAVDDSS